MCSSNSKWREGGEGTYPNKLVATKVSQAPKAVLSWRYILCVSQDIHSKQYRCSTSQPQQWNLAAS